MQNSAFDGKKCMGVGDVNFGKAMIKRPRMVHGWSPMHHDDKGTFAAEEVYKKLEKGVDCKSLRL